MKCEIIGIDSKIKCDVETFIKRIDENRDYFKTKVD